MTSPFPMKTTPWSCVNQKWGHNWHSMCSYLGSFPPALARTLISLFSRENDIVMDPFSGRGTTLLESRLINRFPLASDLNPIAISLSRAKNSSVTEADVIGRIDELRAKYDNNIYTHEAYVQSDNIKLIFHEHTLGQLCFLRRRLANPVTDVDNFLVGSILGIMHGSERLDGTSSYASISMPNTFSMSPSYVRKYVEQNNLERNPRDIFEILKNKVNRLFTSSDYLYSSGIVAKCDVLSLSKLEAFEKNIRRVKLVLTSPPYLDVVNYSKQNWIRDWFLSFNSKNDEMVLKDNLALHDWHQFIINALIQIKEYLSKDGVIVLVLGDVSRNGNKFISLAREVIQLSLHNKLFSYVGCFPDELPQNIKTTRIWKETKGKATNVDRIVVLSDSRPSIYHENLGKYFPPQAISNFSISCESLEDYALSFAGINSSL